MRARVGRRRRAGGDPSGCLGLAAATVFACWLPFDLGLRRCRPLRPDGPVRARGDRVDAAHGLRRPGVPRPGRLLPDRRLHLRSADGRASIPDARLLDPNAGTTLLLAVARLAVRQRRRGGRDRRPAPAAGRGHDLAFATLAFALIAWSLLYAQTGSTGGRSASPVTKRLELFGHQISGASHAALVWGLVGLALLLSTTLVASRVGRALQAIAVNEPAAAASGSTSRSTSSSCSSSPQRSPGSPAGSYSPSTHSSSARRTS